MKQASKFNSPERAAKVEELIRQRDAIEQSLQFASGNGDNALRKRTRQQIEAIQQEIDQIVSTETEQRIA